MIKAQNLCFSYGDKQLVKDVNLEIRPGELLAVVGPNGAGKSSLLKLLSGENAVHKGHIYIDDKSINQYKRDELARTRSVVNQHCDVSFPFSLGNIVEMGRYPHSTTADVDLQIVQEAMQTTAVGALSNRIFNTLSGGEQQRGQMARAIAQIASPEPSSNRYILLDEPIANMDLTHQHGTLSNLKGLTEKGIGVFIILHDLNLASLYADRIAVINNSELETIGTPKEVITKDLLAHTFHLQADINFHPRYGCPLVSPIIH